MIESIAFLFRHIEIHGLSISIIILFKNVYLPCVTVLSKINGKKLLTHASEYICSKYQNNVVNNTFVKLLKKQHFIKSSNLEST